MDSSETMTGFKSMKKNFLRNSTGSVNWVLMGIVWVAGLSACSSEPEPEKTCRELGAELRSTIGGENPAYRVMSPNGGETFTTGDTLKIKVIAADDEKDAQIEIRFVDQAGTIRLALWPGQTQSLNLHEQCEFSTVIPDSILAGSAKVRLISDKVKIRVSNYSTSSFRDESDTTFTIKAP
jgi:hypothetical protein